MKHLGKKWALLLSLVVALGAGQFAKAGNSASIAALKAGAVITDGDKQISLVKWLATSVGNVSLPAEAFIIATLTHVGSDYAFTTQFLGGVDVVGPGSALDIAYWFNVTVLDPTKSIDTVDLDLGGFNVKGGGSIKILESVLTNPGFANLANMQVGQPVPGVSHDVAAITPQTSIQVRKDIILTSLASGASVHMSDFAQSFHQTTGVPEPGSCVLMGIGLAFGAVAWRRRKAA